MALLSRILAGAALYAGLTGAAAAADVLRYDPDPGACAEPWVLKTISRRFDYQVRHVPHLPDVSIQEFRNIHERRYLPAMEDRPIGRRYCAATVDLSDGRDRSIWYLIEEGQGFASIGDNVEFCVSGFDRWHVYNGNCRVLK